MADEKDLILGGEEEQPEMEMYDPIDLMAYLIEAYNFLDSIDPALAGGPKTKENIIKMKRKCLELILSSIDSL